MGATITDGSEIVRCVVCRAPIAEYIALTGRLRPKGRVIWHGPRDVLYRCWCSAMNRVNLDNPLHAVLDSQ